MAVESNGNVDSGRQGFDIFGDLMRRHRAGRVHNGDFVKTAVGEHLGFLSKLLCREHIGLHQRITALDSGGFDQTDALAGTCAVTGVCADAQELQAVFFCQSNIGFVYILVAKEHADLGLGQIGLDQFKVLNVRARCNGAVGLVCTETQAVAHLDGGDTAFDHAFDHQLGQFRVKALADNIRTVTQGAVHNYGADIPMTVVGIVMKVFQIVVAIVVGIAAGCQPLVGYNYGAGHIDRVRQILKTMMAAEIAVGLVSLLCFQMFPRQITALFGSGDALYEEFAVMAFRIFLCTIPLCCVQKAGSIFLQSLGRPLEAMSLSLLREIVLSIPLAILLPMFSGVTGTLYSAPVADVVSCTITVVILTRVMGKLKMEV